MRKIKVLIVEDEVIVANDIAHYLKEFGCEVLAILIEGEDVLPLLEKELPDIILMDISLRGELDGIQTVKLINQHFNIPIIYLTANTDDRSFSAAKDTKPFAFVEKPFKSKHLIRAVELVIEHLVEKEEENNKEEFSQIIMNDRIFVRDKGKLVKILIQDIFYIEADGAYSKIVAEGKTYLVALNLRNLKNKISNNLLMRVHRSYIINLQKVESIEDNYVSISKKSIPVSRTNWSDFLSKVKVI